MDFPVDCPSNASDTAEIVFNVVCVEFANSSNDFADSSTLSPVCVEITPNSTSTSNKGCTSSEDVPAINPISKAACVNAWIATSPFCEPSVSNAIWKSRSLSPRRLMLFA